MLAKYVSLVGAVESAGFVPLSVGERADLSGDKSFSSSASRSPLDRWWYGSRSGSTPAGLLLASLRVGDLLDRERDKRGLSARPLGIEPRGDVICSPLALTSATHPLQDVNQADEPCIRECSRLERERGGIVYLCVCVHPQ